MRRDNQVLETGFSALAIVCRYYKIVCDEEVLQHRHGRPCRFSPWSNLIRAATDAGLRAKHKRVTAENLSQTPLPAVVRLTDGSFGALGRAGASLVLLRPGVEAPRRLSETDFDSVTTGDLLLLRKRGFLFEPDSFDVRWFLPSILKHRRLLGHVLVASLFIQVFALITPLFFQVVIDKVLVHHGLTTLDVLAMGMVVIAVFEVMLGGVRTYVFSHTSSRIDVTLGSQLFRHLLSLPMTYFEHRRVGDTVARVRELDTVRQFITGSGLTLSVDLLFTVVFFLVMFAYSPLLTFIVAGTVPFYIVLSVLMTPILRTRLDEKFARGADSHAFLVETVTGIETIKGNAVEPDCRERWEETLAGYVRANFRANNISNIANQAANFINKLMGVVILWYGAHLVIEGVLSVGQLVAFNLLAGRVSAPVLRISQLWQEFQQARMALLRLGDVLNASSEPAYASARHSLPKLRGRLSIENLSFRYQLDRPLVLDAVQLQITPGEIIGVVGASGSGKSTLAKLLQRNYVPTSGRIMIDDVDIMLVDPVWLRRSIGVVSQEPFLFNRSIRENIALREPTCSMDRVVTAARLAGAHDFIVDLASGYDTMLHEHGVNLSGGQRQRIALARALLTNPRILILDEATSALDYESERLVQRNMAAICEGRTVIIVAHRLSALRSAQRLVVLERGRVVETGSHETLLEACGTYARIFASQHADALN